LFVGGYGGGYFLSRPAFFNIEIGMNPSVVWAAGSSTPVELARKLRQAGIGYVLVNRWGSEPFYDYWKVWDWKTPRDLMVWRDYWQYHAVFLWERGYFSLYKLSDEPVKQSHRVLPGYEDENVRLAMRSMYLRDIHNARIIISMMSQLVPDSPGLMMVKARYYFDNGEIGKAKGMRRQLNRAAPGSVFLKRCDVWQMMQDGRLREAEFLLKSVVTAEPDSPMVWLDLAMVCKRQNRLEEARLAEAEQQKADEAFLDR